MASILDLLKTETGQKLINGASEETGVSKDKAGSVLSMALPAILGSMKNNAESDEGEKNLNNALESDEHDGSILDNLGGMLGGGDKGGLISKGAGILKHVMGGGEESALTDNISKVTGVDSSSISKIIKMAMPVVMGFLGNQKKKDGTSNNITSLLSSAMGTSGDGNLLGDVASNLLGGDDDDDKSGGGLGGLF